MRELSGSEDRNLAVLTAHSVESALLEITATGHEKSIMDATAPLRRLLKEARLHDYDEQAQGQQSKVELSAVIHTNSGDVETLASLYRPNTKSGDPRIWFRGLKKHCSPSDILAISIEHGTWRIHVANLSSLDLDDLSRRQGHAIQRFLRMHAAAAGAVASELLDKLRELNKLGPIPSVMVERADTAVGRTLEDWLGISMNASKAPDYKGIELKSFRKRPRARQVRKSLFAQVPDWNISKIKSSAGILDAFGYHREGEFKLYCQVSATQRNSQGLMLRLDTNEDLLFENSDQLAFDDFATWRMQTLRDRLKEKHAETFWIGAKSTYRDGQEYLHYTEAVHTRAPLLGQFEILLSQGVITMDHLIKRTKTGSAKEKGPIFKIKPDALPLLFPPPEYYLLADAA